MSSVLHKYAQNQVTLLVHISPTMFVPNFVHSYNFTHDCDMLIVVISDGRHKPITQFFIFYITSHTPFHAIYYNQPYKCMQKHSEKIFLHFVFCFIYFLWLVQVIKSKWNKILYYISITTKYHFPTFKHRKHSVCLDQSNKIRSEWPDFIKIIYINN